MARSSLTKRLKRISDDQLFTTGEMRASMMVGFVMGVCTGIFLAATNLI